MRNPYIGIITEYQKEHVKHFAELGFKIASDFFEKTIIWIIGLSSGTIVLIFTQLNKASDNSDKLFLFNQSELKWISIFLVCSIVSGIIGRILYAIALYRGYAFISQFYLNVNELALPFSPTQLKGDETSEYVYLLFQEEFNIDLPIILENKKAASEINKSLEDVAARKLYDDYSELIVGKIKNAKKSISNLKSQVYMISKPSNKQNGFVLKKLKKIIYLYSPNKGEIWRTFTWLSFNFYILSALLFLLAILYFVFKLYCRH